MDHNDWPPLRLREWEPTYLTLHRWLQIVGKIKLALAPPVNHWWQVALYVTPGGITTATLPFGNGCLTVNFDFVAHSLTVLLSDGRTASFALEPMPVAAFYARTMAALHELGVEVRIWPVPVEVTDQTPFTEDRIHASYDRQQIERVHRILLSVDRVFARFRGTFLGKCSPVHLFWGAFDFAVTRFSGRKNPDPPKDRVMHAAYSHEVISHGFWPGGDWPTAGRVEEAIFYSYAIPEPEGLPDARIEPEGAYYDRTLHEFVVPYESIRTAPDPATALTAFMQSTYSVAADRGRWPRKDLDTSDPLAA